jgi:hypothetical protein
MKTLQDIYKIIFLNKFKKVTIKLVHLYVLLPTMYV